MICIDCKEPADLLYILDDSGSIGRDGFESAKKFVRDVTDSLDIARDKWQVSLMRFSTDSEVVYVLFSVSTETFPHLIIDCSEIQITSPTSD